MSEYDAWLNQPVETTARLDPWPARALSAVLGRAAGPSPGDDGDLPCLWQWLYFLETPDHEKIGPDGHPVRGDFLPPIPHPRRMFAGGRTTVHRPLRLGFEASLTRSVVAIEEKRPGPEGMWLVTIRYQFRQNGADCVTEERDYVYLAGVAAPWRDAGPVSPPEAIWRAEVTPDPVTLMRFSALTFNGHRIHYDKDYAVTEEGYPERVTHGPLTAILLAEFARRESGRTVADLSFRARSPLFVNGLIHLGGNPKGAGAELSAHDHQGTLAMSVKVSFGA
ncbi:hypothetical protein [Brevundimonas sp.]|uniref:hypothetical protein n=1 Tax=Brevundimonas sp. TaxID=1871086 RepID=UPI003D12DDDA